MMKMTWRVLTGLTVVFLLVVFGVPLLLGVYGSSYWDAASSVATTLAAGAAIVYVVLTGRLWQEAASEREGRLMLRLVDEYDSLREPVSKILACYHTLWRAKNPEDFANRFLVAARSTVVEDHRAWNALNDARYLVSRFFVRVRKLVKAKFLSERVVVAALDRRAIELFLDYVDPLDKAKAGENYRAFDHDFYKELLTKYPSEDR